MGVCFVFIPKGIRCVGAFRIKIDGKVKFRDLDFISGSEEFL